MKNTCVKLNPTEKSIIQKKYDDSFELIRVQNTLKKENRNQRAIEKAKKVRDTMSKWLNTDSSINMPNGCQS
jgi:hypothetical protein